MQPSRQSVVVACAVLFAAVATGFLVASGDHGTRVETAAGMPSSGDAGLTVALPDGWRELPRVERADPTEVLVVGTADRPTGDPIQPCSGDNSVAVSRSAYVSIYEYRPGDTFASPARDFQYAPEMFQPRPTDIHSALTTGSDCPAPVIVPIEPSTNPPPAADTTLTSSPVDSPNTSPIVPPIALASNHVRELAFSDGGRSFVARIVSVDDLSGELLAQGFTVLNSLGVKASEVTPSTGDHGPADEASAKQQIIDAIDASFGTPSPTPNAVSVEGGHPFTDPAEKQRAGDIAQHADPLTRQAYAAAQEHKIVARIDWIAFDSPTHARLNFDLLVDGQPITANTSGDAVFEDGYWRIARHTYCEIAARGGVQCPT
jgi:hypothetical protein